MVTIKKKEQTEMFEGEELTPENEDFPQDPSEEYEDVDYEEEPVTEEKKETALAKKEPDTELSIEEELEQKFLHVSMALKVAAKKHIKKPEFWTKWGDKYRPCHPALARCAKRVGISWDTKLVEKTVTEDYVSVIFQCKMEFTKLLNPGEKVWDVGNPAFGGWDSLKPAYTHVEDMRTVYIDIYKSGSSQAEVNAFMMLMGIKNMDEDDMKQLGLDTSRIGSVKFKKRK